MKKFTTTDAAALVIWLLPIAYLVYVYSSLPVSVPIHFGADGKPNGYGSKNDFVLIQLFLMFISAFVYFILKFLPVIDPKKTVKYGEANFAKLAIGLVLFLSAISIGIIFSTINKGFKIDKLILPASGFLFAFLGNVMYNIKPNYFAGIRTPWTLEDDGNWRATHHVTGVLWFIGGIIMAVIAFVLPAPLNFFVFMGITAVIVIIPFIYSYKYFKKHPLK